MRCKRCKCDISRPIEQFGNPAGLPDQGDGPVCAVCWLSTTTRGIYGGPVMPVKLPIQQLSIDVSLDLEQKAVAA
ncbi:hypothetical protein [Armatimonas rosea]|uniref:Uncharacterized protein n=1 Tax=Armatimonas rosea TaxID=685828 RepID=A0A7W9SUZ3_ARMRO|nr:hypothetical protein [Armatimonas rosea]MBB6053321.1 hypothetical protein [Armatimonas rosea]